MEYRTYGLHAAWCLLLAAVLPLPVSVTLALLWAVYSRFRSAAFRSNLTFWRQAYLDSPHKIRTRTRYAEQLMLDIERRMKNGESFNDLQPEITQAHSIIEGIVQSGRQDKAEQAMVWFKR